MLSEQNIEAELSYAYLHAVTSRAGFSCEYRNRHLDGAGVDATITVDGRRLTPDSLLSRFSIDVQLKATAADLPERDGLVSYALDVRQYDILRDPAVFIPPLLVLLRLPSDRADWLTVTPDGLVARRCAYWVSLFDAGPSANKDNQTVYIPTANVLSPDGLHGLMTRFSRREVIRYEGRTATA